MESLLPAKSATVGDELYLAPDVFVVPVESDRPILYAPLRGTVIAVPTQVAKVLQASVRTPKRLHDLSDENVHTLVEAGILTSSSKAYNAWEKVRSCNSEHGLPTDVTLFITTKCNLKCLYCYADAGSRLVDMDESVAQRAIDYVITNARKQEKHGIGVSFHGGGEPFTRMRLLRSIVRYAQERSDENGLRVSISSGTNGVLTAEQREWITENLSSVNISLDGPPDIQNAMRPKISGAKSFESVAETIRFFEERKFSYSIRATVTDKSVHRLIDIVDCVRSISSVRRLHLEPVVRSFRAEKNGVEVSPDDFISQFQAAQQYASSRGIDIFYSGPKSSHLIQRYCGACGTNFYVTADGFVSSCLEVVDSSDHRASSFIYGKITKTGVQIYERRKRRLANRTVNRVSGCTHCFAKYNCAGDCPVRVMNGSGSLYSSAGNFRCAINRHLLAEELKSLIAEKSDIQRGISHEILR